LWTIWGVKTFGVSKITINHIDNMDDIGHFIYTSRNGLDFV
jgi:hypothetical protein